MATVTKSARMRSQKQPTAPKARRAAGKRAARGRTQSARASKPKARSASSASTRASARATPKPATKPKSESSRFKRLAGAFGEEWTKSAISSEHPALASAVREGLCVLQFGPRPDRMSWVSMTNGLSSSKGRPELVVHWRQRDERVPVRVLAEAARYALSSPRALTAGDIIAAGDEHALKCELSSLPHWLICAPDKALADAATQLGQLPLALVLGITDGELQCALKVRPEVADGRKVLLEALRIGQVYPVTDPERLCMTRRRDFHRIWESAFQAVRNK